MKRVNEAITAPCVVLVGADGALIGRYALGDAVKKAREAGCDLVEVQPTANPPVCRMMPPGRAEKRAEAQAGANAPVEARVLRFPPGVADTDFRLKVRHGKAFLAEGGAVEVCVGIGVRGDRAAARDEAKRMVERVVAELSPEGVPSGSLRREHDELMILVLPRAQERS